MDDFQFNLFTSLRYLENLTLGLDHKESSFTPNVSVRVDTDGIFWLVIDSDVVSYLNGGPMIEEASSQEELREVVRRFADTLLDMIDNQAG